MTNSELMDALTLGQSVDAIAQLSNAPPAYVHSRISNLVSRGWVTPVTVLELNPDQPRIRSPEAKAARLDHVAELYRAGQTIKQIATAINRSHARVTQLVRELFQAGRLTPRRPGRRRP